MVFYFSKPGAARRQPGPGNQDRVCVLRAGSIVCAAVADGWGGSDLSQLGAEGVSLAAAEYLLCHFDRLYGRETSNALRYELVLAVQAALDRLAMDLGVERGKLASTLLVLCRDTADGRYISCHIGDGLAAWRGENGLGLLSAPENGLTRQFTTLTDSSRIFSAARIHRGQKPGAVFLLMTDGCAGDLWDGSAFRGPGVPLLQRGDWTAFENSLAQNPPADDHSFVAL